MRTVLKRALSVFLALALILSGIPGVPEFMSPLKRAIAAGGTTYERESDMDDLTQLMNEFGFIVFNRLAMGGHQHSNIITNVYKGDGGPGNDYNSSECTIRDYLRADGETITNYIGSFEGMTPDFPDSVHGIKFGYQPDTLVLGSGNTVTKYGNQYKVNGHNFSASGTVYTDTADKKYIDLQNLQKNFGYYNGQLSELEATATLINGRVNNRSVEVDLAVDNGKKIVLKQTSGLAVLNLTAADLQGISDRSFTIELPSGDSALLINVDMNGRNSFCIHEEIVKLPLNSPYTSNDDHRTVKLIEDLYKTDYNRIIWNLYDSGKTDGNYTGTVTLDDKFLGTIIAPYAELNAKAVNGMAIVNKATVTGESHRINPSSTLPGPEDISKADFTLIKTYDGANLERMRQADRNTLLQNTEFTLKKQDGTVVGTKSLIWNADSRRAEVVFDDISCGEDADTYFYKLVETKAPNGYVLSSVEVDCKVVRNTKTGELETFYKRSTEGDNAYSETFPSFANARKANIHPSVTMADWTYGEEASEPVLGENSNPGNGEVTYTYYKIERPGRETKLDGKPENAGDYRVVATIAETDAYNGGNASKNFTIHKAENEIDVAFDDVYVHVNGSIDLSDYLLDDEAVGEITYQIQGTAHGCSVDSNGNFTGGRNAHDIIVKITAAGDENHEAASVNITVHVQNRRDNTTTVEVTGKEYDGEPVSVVINKDPNGGEPKVTYQKKNADGQYEDIGSVAPTDAGEYRLLVEIPAWGWVAGKNFLEDFTITKASLKITAKDETYTYNGSAQGENEKTYTTDFDSKVTVEGLKGNDALTSVTLNGQETNAGTYTEKIVPKDAVVGENTDNYEITYISGDLEIEKAKLTITAASQEFVYDGTSHSNGDFVVDGLKGSDSVTATVEGSITYPRESPVANVVKSYTFVSGSADNYDITLVSGELTMKSAGIEITIKAADDTKTYDGTPLTNSTVTITEGQLLEGDRLVAEADGSALNVADTETGNNTVKPGYKIMRGDQDVTENYAITVQPGTLTITPAKVTITAKSEAFVYDGKAHSNDGYTVSGLVSDDAIEAVVTGEITFPSESPVTNELTSYEFANGTPGNYEVTTANGSLTMTNAEVAITIKAQDGEWTYDGQSHTNNTVTVTSGELLPGDTLVAVAGGSVTNVYDTATGNNTITSYKIMHGDEDVTGNYAVTTEAGTLTVTPKSVTITAMDKEFTYNGKEQSFPEYTVEGLVGNDAINAVVEGSITYPKQSPVANEVTSYEFTTGDKRNYSVSTEDGELTMKKADIKITVTAADGEWVYDGNPHSNTTVTLTNGDLLDGDALEATAGGVVTNVSDTEENNNPVTYCRIMHGNEDVTDNYDITTVPGTLTITKAPLTIIAKDEEFVYNAEEQGEKGSSYSGDDVNQKVMVDDGLIDGDILTGITLNGVKTNVGEYTECINPTGAGIVNEKGKDVTENYDITYNAGTLKITKAPLTITAKDQQYTFNGGEQGESDCTYSDPSGIDEKVSVDGLCGNDTLTGITLKGTETDAGVYENKIASTAASIGEDGSATDNYDITYVPGKLTIDPKKVTITAKSEEFTYDGQTHQNNGYDVDGLCNTDKIEADVSGSITFPNESPVENVVNGYEFTSGNSDNYIVETVNGKLTMKKAAVAITITAGSDEKTYDGQPLTNSEVTITEGELLPGDKLVATATGSITNAADNKTGNNLVAEGYKIMHGDEDVTENYVITTVAGTLKINPAEVTVTAKDKAFAYTGEAQNYPEYTVDGLVGDDAISAVVTGSITYPRESPVTNKLDSYEFTKGDPANYNVTVKNGKLTMTNASAAITIKAADDEWTYDGTEHGNPEVTVTEGTLFPGDELVATATGSVTNVSDTATGNNTVAEGYKIMHGEEDVTNNYAITVVSGTLTVTKAPLTITAKDQQYTFNGGEQGESDCTYSDPSGIDEKVSVDGLCGNDTLTGITLKGTETDAGVYENKIASTAASIGEDGSATDNYDITYVPGKLTIDPKKVTITAKSEEFTYDGQTHQNNGYDVDGLCNTDKIEADVSGSITFPNESPVENVVNGYEFTSGNSDNYIVETVNGKLTMKKAAVAITITAGSDEKTYDGQPLTNSEVTITEGELLPGDKLVATATGSITNAADNKTGNNLVAEGYKIMHGDEDVTENYVITTVAGTLKINPAEVTVTAKDKAFAYTGEAQNYPEYTVDGLVGDDAISAVVTGSITYPRESPVTNKLDSYEFTKGDPANYNVTVKNGKLTMTNASAAITIKAADDEWTYDGTEHGNPEVTVTEGTLFPGDELVATATGSVTNVSDTATGNNTVAEGYKIMHGEEDVTNNYAITVVSGTLTVTPKNVTITAESQKFTYDGMAHSNAGYDVDGLCGDDRINADITGSIRFPSDSPVTNKVDSYQFTSGYEKNYKVTTVDGQLTMVNAEKAIVIKAADDEWTYDGKAHSNKEVTLEEGTLFPGDTLEAVASGSVTNVSDTKAGNNPVADGYKIMHGTEDVTKNYKITTKAGTLTIKKADDPAVISTDGKDTEVTVNTLEDDDHKIDLNQFVEGNEGDVTFEIKDDGSDASENASIDENGNLIPGDETGKITVIVKIADSENHEGREVEIVIDVTPKETAKIAVTQGDTTYGQDLPKPQITGVPDDVDNKDITIEYKKKGDTEYTTTPPTEAGEYTIRVTIPETSEHTGATAEDDFTIAKAKDPAVIDASGDVVKNNPNPEDNNSVKLEDLVKGAEGEVTFEIIPDGTTATDAKIDKDNNLVPGKETGEVKVKVTISDSENHTGKTEIITITVTDKDTKDITVTQKDTTYGEELPKPEYTAPEGSKTTVTYTGTLPDGTTVVLPEGETPTEAGTYIVTVTCETGDTIYTGKAEFEIKKAIPEIGTVSAKEVHNSTDIADAKVGRSDTTIPGNLTITETKLETGENTYHWTFVPEDTNNYETISGTVAITVTGHEWSAWEIVKPATTEQEGLARRVCTVCGEIETMPIPKLDPKTDPEEDPKPNPNPPIEYKAEGTGKATYIDESYKDISFVIHRSTDDSKTTELFENIEVGGKKLVKGEDYIIGEGGTITFVSKYLETLPIGEVDLTVVFKDGTTKLTVVVKTNESTPKTGDAGLLVIWLVLLCTITVWLVARRRREEEDEVSGYMA